jgi:hypothetical protein
LLSLKSRIILYHDYSTWKWIITYFRHYSQAVCDPNLILLGGIKVSMLASRVVGPIMIIYVWYLDWQLHMQSVPITTKVVILKPAHGEVYSIQHYVIKFVSDLRQVCGFLRVLRFPPPIKLTTQYNWYIVESDVKYPNPLKCGRSWVQV